MRLRSSEFAGSAAFVVGTALLASLLTLLLGVIEIARISPLIWGSNTDEVLAAAIKAKELARWLWLAGSVFLATLVSGTLFEVAHRSSRDWLFVVATPIALALLFLASTAAYIPERELFRQGWVYVSVSGLARYASLLAGSSALLVSFILRRLRRARPEA